FLMYRKRGFIFTGQGSQTEQMGLSLYEKYDAAKEIYALLPEDLRELSFHGALAEISKTEHLQPIMLALQISILKILEANGIRPDAVCGLSLGEYSALVAAGALQPEEAIRVIRVRGAEMARAAEKVESGMAAVIGMPEEEIAGAVAGLHAYLSNINSSRQIVISGEKDAVTEASRILKEKGGKVLPLNVTGPFHTPYMEDAVPGLKEALDKVEWKEPKTDYYTNTTGKVFAESFVAKISENMLRQMTGPVRLYDCLKNMVESGIEELVEIGSGKVVSAIVKKEFPQMTMKNIENAEDLEKYLADCFG
ncbi:MAG: ACP S-malonyltransferase, partial [Bacillota bacterium]|nr:ACP S-malonyltransferase [Bacillota bacterium]